MDWKKEIKLGDIVGRKDDAAAPTAVHADEQPAAAEEQKSSFWKRELTVRKPKEEGGKPPRKQLSRFAATPQPKHEGGPVEGATDAVATDAVADAADAAVREVVERRSRFTRFTRAGESDTEASPAERKPSRFARPTKSGDSAKKPKEKKPSRFARPGARGSGTATEEKTKAPKEKKARSFELSFKRKPKEAAEAGAPKTAKRSGAKKGQVVGLKIGASHIAAAQVTQNGQVDVLQFAREPLEKGIVVGGELRDADALGVHLKEFFRKHKLPVKGVRLGVGTNRIGVRRFEITGLADPSHLENAIRFRAQEVLPIPLEEAVLDYQVVGEETDEKGQKTYRVLLVVAYRDLVARYVRACRAAGVKLVGIDLEAFALLRALGPTATTARDDSAVVIVSIGHDRSTFVVADGSTCEFARVLDWGGSALDVAVARSLDLTPSQAEHIKHSLTLNATQERLDGYSQEQAVAVYESVRKELQNFVRELVSSLHFYQNQPGSLGIGEITITGGTAQLPGLAAELQRLIGVTVRVGDPFARVDKHADVDGELGSAAVAIGLGIEA
jgi:type IV pilus assembly protein PilM